MDALDRRVGAELGHVEVEVVVRRLPRGVEHERGRGDRPLGELGDGVADLPAAAPHVGGDPRPEVPWRRDRRPAGVAGVAAQHVDEHRPVDEVDGEGREPVEDDEAVGRAGAQVEGDLRRRVEVQAVAAGAHEPRRDLVGAVALGPGVVEGEDVDPLAGLVEGIELLAEAVEMLVRGTGAGERGLRRLDRPPVGDLVAQHAVVHEAQRGGHLAVAGGVGHGEGVRRGRRRHHPAELERRALRRQHRRRGQGHHVGEHGAGEVGARQLDVTGALEHAGLEGAGAQRERRPGRDERPRDPVGEARHGACLGRMHGHMN